MNKKLEDYLYWQRLSMSTMVVAMKNISTATNEATYRTNKLKKALHSILVSKRKKRK